MTLFLLFSIIASASDVNDIWVRAENRDQKIALQSLRLGFVEGMDGDWFRMHADPKGMERLRSSGLQYRPFNRSLVHETGHLQPAEMVEALSTLSEDHPETAQLIHLGWSVNERPVYGLRISQAEQASRSVRILGAHHGDETSSAEVSLEVAKQWLESPSDAMNTWLQKHEVWIVPHVNPDGIANLDRYNANNVDLNRNYGYQWSEYEFRSGDGPFSEPETRNIRALGTWVPAGLGLSVHSGATNIGWVWNYTEERTQDDELLEAIAARYASHCTTEDFWITNGADWYVTNGDTTDWSYGRYGTLDYTLEVSQHKHPGAVQMAQVVANHTDAIEQAILWPFWVAGQVTDATTANGIPATIHLDEVEQPIVTGPDGRFSRPSTEDVVSVRIESSGFVGKELLLNPNEEALEIMLDRDEESPNGPTNIHLDPSGEFFLTLPATEVHFQQPGHEPVRATAVGDAWTVESASLKPGFWDLAIDGIVSPRAVFVPDPISRVVVSSHVLDGDKLTLQVENLGEGAHAWFVTDDVRMLLPATSIQTGDTTLAVITPDFDGGWRHVVVWTAGQQVLYTLEEIPPGTQDTGTTTDEPDGDTASTPPPSGEAPHNTAQSIVGADSKLSTGCDATRSYPAFFWLVSLVGLLRIRRTSCEPFRY